MSADVKRCCCGNRVTRTCTYCKTGLCNECTVKCATCSVRIFCSDCASVCSECGDVICGDCAKHCLQCRVNELCYHCARDVNYTCPECHKRHMTRCDGECHKTDCGETEECCVCKRRRFCDECIDDKMCEACDEVVCDDCVVNCSDCGDYRSCGRDCVINTMEGDNLCTLCAHKSARQSVAAKRK